MRVLIGKMERGRCKKKKPTLIKRAKVRNIGPFHSIVSVPFLMSLNNEILS